jgi:YD repeat-containing protein
MEYRRSDLRQLLFQLERHGDRHGTTTSLDRDEAGRLQRGILVGRDLNGEKSYRKTKDTGARQEIDEDGAGRKTLVDKDED